MNEIGLALIIIGALLVGASAFALSCIRGADDESPADSFEFFLIGGLILALRDLIKAIGSGFRRRSPECPLLILLGVGIAIFVVGCILI
ncbi:MAG: hypothetical protein ACR2RV_05415 [Verrucomicrobiales bacterium]